MRKMEKDVREGMVQAQTYLAVHHSGQNLGNRPEQKNPSSQPIDKSIGSVSVLVCRLDFKSSGPG
jgi:hypothetical protein